MKRIDILMKLYGESHQNKINKLIHWLCIPLILFSFIGLLRLIPFISEKSVILNWAAVVLALSLLYYIRLSRTLSIGFTLIAMVLLFGNQILFNFCTEHGINTAAVLFGIFIIAWIGQFIGHKIEGKKPSFFEDLQFLLIGPAWLLVQIYNKSGIRY